MGKVDKLRSTMLNFINENPATIVAWIRPTKVNDAGFTVPDISQAAVETAIGTGRVNRRSLPDPYISGSTTPYDYKDVFYLLMPYDNALLRKGLVFVYGNNKFKTRIPETRYIFGSAIYLLCGLEQVTSSDVGDQSG